MNIVVCLKSCRRADIPLRLGGGGAVLQEGGAPPLPSPQELAPLQAALALKGQIPGTGAKVAAISVGPPAWEPLLRHALALGADEVIRVWDESWALLTDDSSTAVTSAEASAAADAMAHLAPQLVLTGDKSGDTGRECFAAMLAHRQGASFAHRAVEIAPEENGWRVRVKLERGYTQEMSVKRPAVVTLAGQPAVLPYPSLPAWMESLAKPIPVIAAAPASSAPRTTLRPPLPRVKRYSLPDAGLDAEGRIRAMVSLPAAKGGTLLTMDMGAEEQARQAARFLRERGYP